MSQAAAINAERPLGMDLPRRIKGLVLAGSMLAMFLAALEQSVVNPALPRIVSDLGGLELYPWLIQAFTIAQLVTIPAAGALSDSLGRKPLLLIGLLIFLGGTGGCGAAGGIYELIGFRAVQGAGAGILMMATFSVVGDLFPPSERGKYIGLFAGVFALSSLIGAPLGGVLTEALSWRWVFWVMFIVGPPALLVIAWKMPWLRPPKQPLRFDWPGLAALLPLLLGLTIAISLGGAAGWTSALVLGLLLLAAVSAVLFILAERRAAVPIVPLHLFRINTIAMVTIAVFLTGVGMMGVMVYLQFFLQVGLGAGAAAAGVVMGPMILVSVGFSVVSGQIMARTGRYKPLAVAGGLLMLGGIALLATMTRETPIAGGVLPRLFVFGIGMGLMMPVLSLAVQNAAPQRYLGRVSGFTQFFQLVGGAIGIGVIGALFNARLASGLESALPADLVDVVLPEKLVDPEFRAELVETLGAEVWAAVEPAVQTVVASAIADNFLLALGILVIAVLALLRMREMPLRTGNEHLETPLEPAPEPAGLQPAANGAAAALPKIAELQAEALRRQHEPTRTASAVSANDMNGAHSGGLGGGIGRGAPDPAWPRAARRVAAAAFVGASLGLAASYAYAGNGPWAAARRWAGARLSPRPRTNPSSPASRTGPTSPDQRRNGPVPRRTPRR